MANLSLVFDLLARDNASGPFKNVGNAAERAGQQTSKFGTAMSGAFKLASGALLGAGLVEGFKALYNAADESRKIAALTAQVIKSTGAAANVSAKQVGDLASAIAKKTGVDDEAIQSGENLLLTFTNVRNQVGKGNDVFSQATKVMTDMSVALGTDASGSAIQLGKALNDPIKGISALQRVGVSFTAAQKEQIKTLVETGDTLGAQKIILAELNKEFGGAAEAAATPLGKLQQRLGDVAEQVGGYLIPAVDKAATFFNDKLLPAFSDIGSTVAGVVIPALQGLAATVGAVAGAFNALPGPLQAGVIALGAFALLKGPVVGAMETFALKALYMKDAFINAGSGFGGLKAAGSGLLGLFGGPWGLALAGATIAVVGISSAMERSAQRTRDWAHALAEGGAAARQATEDMQKAPGVWDRFGFALTHAGDSVGVVGQQTREAKQALEDYRASLDPVAEAQSRVTEWTNTLSDRLVNGKVTTEDARTAQERLAYWTDVLANRQSNLKDAVAGATAITKSFEQQTKDARDALDQAKTATDDFKLSLDMLSGANVSAIELESRFQAALDAADGALKNLSGSALNASGDLDLQSEAGRKAADVLLDVRNSGNDLIATMIQQGATTDQVQAKDAELRQSFLNTAAQMGITGQSAETLANKILGIPGERVTTITADTGRATTAVANIQTQIDLLHGRTVTIDVVTAKANVGIPSGSAPGFALGGYTGDGAKFTPAGVVHAGEFVFTKEETAKAGVGRLSALAKSLRGYATGGVVAPVSILAELDTRTYESQMNAAANQVAKDLEPVTGLIGALSWARSQVGKPYIWGGVGPAGYDCSGFMSAITNYIRGRSPHSRVGSTANFPWAGFTGGDGLFTIGSTANAGGGIGHMAGTLLGVNVESTGDHVRVGGDARGSSNGLFGTRAHLAMAGGGVIGEPVSGIGHYSGRSYSFGEKGPETVTPGLPSSGPMDLSDATINRLAAAMLRGAGAVVRSDSDRRGIDSRSWQ